MIEPLRMAYFGLAFYPIMSNENSIVTVMFDDLTWMQLLQAWPRFGAAVLVFVVAVGLFIALKPKPKRHIPKRRLMAQTRWDGC